MMLLGKNSLFLRQQRLMVRLKKLKEQKGYLLLIAIVFLFILGMASLHFFNRSSENLKMSGALRDSATAQLLAESAMEHMRGQFVMGRLDSDPTIRVSACDNGSGATFDMCESSLIQKNRQNPDDHMFPYMFYITDGNGIDSKRPSLLQRVADGESRFSEVDVATSITGHAAPNARELVRIEDLFAGSTKPLLYIMNDSGKVESSLANSWNAETHAEKAAAWFEVVQNSSDTDAIDIYVQSAAQVGNSRSYVQRYVGTFTNGTVLGVVSAVSEASNVDRSV